MWNVECAFEIEGIAGAGGSLALSLSSRVIVQSSCPEYPAS